MSSYKDLAHEQAVVTELQRVMMDRYVQSDSRPKQTVIAENVFYNEREVPQDMFLKVLEKLQYWETHLQTQMRSFKWVEGDAAPPFLQKEPAAGPKAAKSKDDKNHGAPAKRKKKRLKPEGPPSHASDDGADDSGEPGASRTQ